MATRSEMARAEAQRQASATNATSATNAKGTPRDRATEPEPEARTRAARDATYAYEAPSADGQRSRKSTRGSANRAKPDAAFNAREELVKGSPTSLYRKQRAKIARVRGHSAAGT